MTDSMLLHSVLVICLVSIFAPVYSRNNVLSVTLDTKWASTPLTAEASEFLASESRAFFWQFINLVGSRISELSEADEIVEFRLIESVAQPLLPKSQFQLMVLALSSRAYSPAVEMNMQLAKENLPQGDCAEASEWVRLGEKWLCSVEEVKKALDEVGNMVPDSAADAPTVFRTDKIFIGGSALDDKPIAFLYGDIRLPQLHALHALLEEAAKKENIRYVFRHFFKKMSPRKTRLSGYGVELAIKSTEYKAVDDTKVQGEAGGSEESREDEVDEVQGFVFSKLRSLHANLSGELTSFKKHLMETDSEIRPLKAWQLQDLSVQAAYEVSQALQRKEELHVLRDLSQNYPLRASSLARVSVPQDYRMEIQTNQRRLEAVHGLTPGQFLFTLNGHMIQKDIDIFDLLDLARRETKLMTRLHSMGITGSRISTLIHTPLGAKVESQPESRPAGYALDIRGAPVTYLNDIEKDRRYAGWPRSVQDLLAPAYPGMMRRVAKNFFHLVLVADPAVEECRDVMRYAEAFIVHQAPVRIGFLWGVDPSADIKTSPGRALIRAFNFVMAEKDDPMKGLSFITEIYGKLDTEALTVDAIKEYFNSRFRDADMDTVFGPESDYDGNLKSAWSFLETSGLTANIIPQALINGIALDAKALREGSFEELVVTAVLEQTAELQRAVYMGRLSDLQTVLDYLMEQPNVVSRLNQRLLDKSNSNFLDFGINLAPEIMKKSDVDPKQLSDEELTTYFANKMKYFAKKDDTPKTRPVTIWLVTDLTTVRGRAFAYEAMKQLKSSSTSRLGFVHNTGVGWEERSPSDLEGISLIRGVQAAVTSLGPLSARNYITKLVKEENVEGKKTLEELSLGGMNFPEFKIAMDGQTKDFLQLHQEFTSRILGVKPGQSLVVCNGKVFGPFREDESFVSEDFKLLTQIALDTAGSAVAKSLEDLDLAPVGSDALSDLTMRVSAVLLKAAAEQAAAGGVMQPATAKVQISEMEDYHGSVLHLTGDSSQPMLDLTVVVDPLTREAQRASHVLVVLKQALNCNIRLILNAKDKHSNPPLSNFYRFAWEPSPVNAEGRFGNPRALFTRLPGQPLLTLGIDAPHSWLVEAVRSPHDLDNLRFSELPGAEAVVHAGFELEHLLLEGHCVDLTTGQPPRGLQFTLGTKAKSDVYDTIVMANLGYFQLKANAGAWYLNLREGRSKEIYNIASHDNTDSSEGSTDVVAVLNSFRSKIIRVRVTKKPDKLTENLLGGKDEEGQDTFWSSISSAFGSSGGDKKADDKEETLNIFSLASGHLYERFLRSMMLSVLKNSKSKVKFWFLKNYLSPTFKDFIPHMAKKYGFEYQLVQYKWPRWLHQQTEKQRIIWGYKILFLDVLFPLSVKKIIYIDADQTVRADLQELADLNLEGAPYGYTPFCNSRREMDGFRFWTSGYWAQHLAGRSYHISALYVVDLAKFRKMAAGDRLRGQYHGLSQDPNSLSNLDQDLPNNMIHQVPIKSLPQEWLWCETWCSDEEKKRAKTIDLCNNPQTKEPKLTAAMRIVPEWRENDAEIRQLWEEVYGKVNATDTPPVARETGTKDPVPPTTDKKTEL